MTLRYQRLRAPSDDGQTLQFPALAEFPETLKLNQQILAEHQFDWSGKSISDIRLQARAELIQLAIRYTNSYRDVTVVEQPAGLIMSGHQPTLFHPGVWYKNFALDSIAKQIGCVAVNLVVDNDQSDLRAIRVPVGDASDPRINFVKYDSRSSQGPFETEKLHNRGVFDSFADRTHNAIRSFVAEPLVKRLWPYATNAIDEMNQPSMAIAAGRHRLEADFGLQTLELPLSHFCNTESFARFAAEIILDASRFREVYNQALYEYRRVHRIRSTAHPVPELAQIDDWIELPFWIWSNSRSNRRGLFVRFNAGEISMSDRDSIELTFDSNSLCQQIYEGNSDVFSLRPRALLTTMYSRLVLSDGFLHGIGGAKYDQLTDQIIRSFFGVQPPVFNTVTATHRLPIKHHPATNSDLQELTAKQRNMKYHAELFVDSQQPDLVQLTKQKRSLIEKIPFDAKKKSGNKKVWHDEIDSVNQQLRAGVQASLDELDQQVQTTRGHVRVNQVLGSREFSFCLFDESVIEKLRVD